MDNSDKDVVAYLREVIIVAQDGDDEAVLLLARSELPRLAAGWLALVEGRMNPSTVGETAHAHLIAQNDYHEVAAWTRNGRPDP